MSAAHHPSIHASAVVCGTTGILIRGPSGSGKSQLAFDLILAGRAGQIPPVRLVGDDRVHLLRDGARVIVRPAEALRGLIEIRGLGIRSIDFAPEADVRLVVDLSAPDGERLPLPAALSVDLEGVTLPRLPVGAGYQPLPIVLAALITRADSDGFAATDQPLSDDRQQGFGNHIRPMFATK
ncbi:MAG: serine kinase [Proteobacteria bacterium SG_bin9]|nr:MAG: serine kinase [Proteobacteria bacterium SG_bin9]